MSARWHHPIRNLLKPTTPKRPDAPENRAPATSLGSHQCRPYPGMVWSPNYASGEPLKRGRRGTWKASRPSHRRKNTFARFEPLEERALLATIYISAVTGSNSNVGSLAHPLQTIQAGVNLAAAGDTLEIAAGTYAENITINKSLTMQGANAGVNPNIGTRKPETIIEPAVDDSTGGVVIDITVPGVVIDGLTVNGANPLLSGGVSLNGTSVNAATGIMTSSELTVQNDIIKNLNQTGILASAKGTPVVSGGVFRDNKVDNIPSLADSGTGIRVTGNYYASIDGNALSRVETGIQIDSFSQPDLGAAAIVDSNTVTFYKSGIDVSNLSSNASPWTISNNAVTYIPLASTASSSGGLLLLSIQTGPAPTILNNDVLGAQYGVEMWNDLSTTIEVQGGTLTGNQIGIWATNADPAYGAGGAMSATVNGVTITGSRTDGVLIDDDPSSTGTVALSVQNSTISDGAVGVEVTGSLATFSVTGDRITGNQTGVQIDDGTEVTAADLLIGNSITANTVAGLIHDGSGTLTAKSNFWGSSTGPTYPANGAGVGQTIIDLTNGGTGTGIVIFSPFLKKSPFTAVVTWANLADITYGTPLGATQLDATAAVPGTFVYTPAPGTVLPAGTGQKITVVFTPTDSVNYDSDTTTKTINVSPAPLVVTALPVTRIYGSSLPALTYSISGFVHGDTAKVVSGAPSLSTTASSSSPPGSYPITIDVSKLSATNYTFVGQNGTLRVIPPKAPVTWANPAGITYGTALGAVQLDAKSSVPGSFAYTPGPGTVLSAGAGEVLSVTFTPADTVDYSPVTTTAMINVKQAPLWILAKPTTRDYGQPNPAFTVTYSGFTHGDSPASLVGSLQFSTLATVSSPVGTYPVIPGGLASPNYAIAFVGNYLMVTPAPLTITANSQSRVFAQPNPKLTVSYQGFVNGDTPAKLTAPAVVSTPAAPGSAVGTYPIIVSGAASPNYAIRFVNGTLTIQPPTNPITLGNMALVTSLYNDLLLASPGPADLYSWLHQLSRGRSAISVATAIAQSSGHKAALREHPVP